MAGSSSLQRGVLCALRSGCGQQLLWPSQQVAAIANQAAGAARYKDAFQAPPHSLEHDRGRVAYPPALEGSPFGRALLWLIGARSKEQQLHNGASLLYDAVKEAAEDRALHDAFGLDPEAFMSVHSLLALHMWLAINRLKPEDRATAAPFQQALYTANFYRDVERRVYREGVTVHVSKWLKKLEQLTYGQWVAYDAALGGGAVGGGTGGGGGSGTGGGSGAGSGGGSMEVVGGGGGAGGGGGGGVGGAPEPPRAAFVTALVRNVYGGDVTLRPRAELLAKYLDREAACLALTPVEAIYAGQVRFSRGGLPPAHGASPQARAAGASSAGSSASTAGA